jgi:hypothetical protein
VILVVVSSILTNHPIGKVPKFGLRERIANPLFVGSNPTFTSKYGYGEMVSLRSPKPQFRVRILVSVLNGGYSSVGRAKDCGSLCHGFDSHYSPNIPS